MSTNGQFFCLKSVICMISTNVSSNILLGVLQVKFNSGLLQVTGQGHRGENIKCVLATFHDKRAHYPQCYKTRLDLNVTRLDV